MAGRASFGSLKESKHGEHSARGVATGTRESVHGSRNFADTDCRRRGGDANYYNKLITLFPAEALTIYGTGVAVFGRSTLAALIVCLVVLVLLRSVATQPQDGGRPHFQAVIVSVISFLLWTTATDPGWIEDARLRNVDIAEIRKWAAFLGAAFVLLAPAFVQPPQPGPSAKIHPMPVLPSELQHGEPS